MEEERLRALALPVLLQILQQVVLEISHRVTHEGGGAVFDQSFGGGSGGCAPSGRRDGNVSSQNGCGGGVATSEEFEGHSIHASSSSPFQNSNLLRPMICMYRCQYCRNRCVRGHKSGHRHHSCHDRRHCRE